MSRRPTPSAIKLLRGTNRRDRANPNEPQPEPAVPECPDHLNEEAKQIWNELSAELHAVRVLSRQDKLILALACSAAARVAKAQRQVDELGEVVRSTSGGAQKSPWLLVAEKAGEQLKGYLVELGCTPSSRTKIKAAPPAKPVDEFAKLMSRKGKKA